MRRGALALADGTLFEGLSVAADGVATGEVVFNTAMAGYQEIVTDPSYAGQVVVMTAPHIGNYGVARADAQSETVHCTGLVTRSMSRVTSSWRAEASLPELLTEAGVVALAEVDTRRLTRHVRHHGAMPAAVGSGVDDAELRSLAAAAPSMEGRDLVGAVTRRDTSFHPSDGDPAGHVVAFDFGIKADIVTSLTGRSLDVTVVPAGTSPDDVMALRPDGVFLSNGPGDPEPIDYAVGTVRALLGRVPIFGICLGHQILGLALGARTFKLPFGHHGGNHPVRDLGDGTVTITSQNHGFAVDLWSLGGLEPPPKAELAGPDLVAPPASTPFGEVTATHQNLNDGTLEGLECREARAFSVQYHPEAAPGPNDARTLFDRFAAVVAAR